jgi:hypothetical protein
MCCRGLLHAARPFSQSQMAAPWRDVRRARPQFLSPCSCSQCCKENPTALRCYGDLGNHRGGRYVVFSAAGLERPHGKVSMGRARCRLVVRRNFPRDRKNPRRGASQSLPSSHHGDCAAIPAYCRLNNSVEANAIRTAMRLRRIRNGTVRGRIGFTDGILGGGLTINSY